MESDIDTLVQEEWGLLVSTSLSFFCSPCTPYSLGSTVHIEGRAFPFGCCLTKRDLVSDLIGISQNRSVCIQNSLDTIRLTIKIKIEL